MLTQIKIDQNTGVIEKTQKLNDLVARGIPIFMLENGIDLGLTPIIKKQIIALEQEKFIEKDITQNLNNMEDYKIAFNRFKINFKQTADIFNRKQLVKLTTYYTKYENKIKKDPSILHKLKQKLINDTIKEINDLSFQQLQSKNIENSEDIKSLFRQTDNMKNKIFNNLKYLSEKLNEFDNDLQEPYYKPLGKSIIETEQLKNTKTLFLFLKIIGGIALIVLLIYLTKSIMYIISKGKKITKKDFILARKSITVDGANELIRIILLTMGISVVMSLNSSNNGPKFISNLVVNGVLATFAMFAFSMIVIITSFLSNNPLDSKGVRKLFIISTVLIILSALYFTSDSNKATKVNKRYVLC